MLVAVALAQTNTLTCFLLRDCLNDTVGKKIIEGLRKAFSIGFGASEHSIFAITQRLLSRSKSAFENAFTYTFLEGLWKWLTARFKEIIVIILLPILGSLSAFLEHCPRIRA